MSRLSRRLAYVEERISVRHADAPGVLEIHLTRAWPACTDSGYHKCREHAPTWSQRASIEHAWPTGDH